MTHSQTRELNTLNREYRSGRGLTGSEMARRGHLENVSRAETLTLAAQLSRGLGRNSTRFA